MRMGRLKRKKTLPKITKKQKKKHKNVTLKFMSITRMIRNMNKTRRMLKLKNRKMQNQKISTRKKFKTTKR